jgi:hypothetical protein
MRTIILFCLLTAARSSPAAETTVTSRPRLIEAIARATAGDTIRIAPGTYAGGIMINALKGTREKPITITAADPDKPPVIAGGANGFHLSGCQWTEISHLQFEGAEANGINVDDGGPQNPRAEGIRLHHLKVAGNAPRGNRDGIKLSGLAGFSVAHCTVTRWGTGGSGVDMVGCHDGTVEACTFRHDPGPASAAANGVQMKGGSSRITVRKCQLLSAGGRAINLGGSTGSEFFRPADAPHEASHITIEDCLIMDSDAAIAFVGSDESLFRHNTIIHPQRWVLRILQENTASSLTPCRRGSFTDNLIVFASASLRSAVNIGPHTDPASFSFQRNAWFCEDAPPRSRALIQLPSPETDGQYGAIPTFTDRGKSDFSQAGGSPLRAFGIRPRQEPVEESGPAPDPS